MRQAVRIALILAIIATSVLLAPVQANAQNATPAASTPAGCPTGTLPHGALWLICIPAGSAWNHDLVVYAHGYTAFNQPLGFQNLTLPDGTSVPGMVEGLGYAFATTSYRKNGLAILEGTQDILELVTQFREVCNCTPSHVYLAGVSEGGLVTTLLMEQHPEVFSGGLAACGPIGSFRDQINYFGDFRVLFDYFFPGVLPPSPIQIPDTVIDNWNNTYAPAIGNALVANGGNALQLITTSKAAVDLSNPLTGLETAEEVLWYNAFATNDAREELGGNPYGNIGRWYWGSADDFLLNSSVERFRADPTALRNLMRYETYGHLTKPLVTLHNVADPVIPFWQEILYYQKAQKAGDANFLTPIPIFSYGHCNFTSAELLASFGLLVQQVTGQPVAGLSQSFNVTQARRDFARAQQDSERRLPVPAH